MQGIPPLTAFAAAEVLPRMQGVPLLTAFAAEGWGGAGGNRGRWAAREKTPATARSSPPPISLSSPRLWRTIPLVAHHSAKRGSVERNLPIYDLRLTTYEKGLWSKVSGFRFQVYDMRCELRLETHTASERRHARSAINTIRSVVMGMPAPVTGISERCY